MNSTTPAVVLRVHHGSLGIARSLGRLGVPVYGLNPELGTPAMASRYFHEAIRWDFSRTPAGQTIEFLLDLGRRIGRPSVLIPTADDVAELVVEHAGALREWYRFQYNPPQLVRAFSNKKELHFLARRHGVPTAETVFPVSLEEVRRYADTAVFPIMLKASDGLRLQARTGKKMVIIRSATELLEQYQRLEDPANPNLMLQEYIPGGDDTIWMFNGYFNARSECSAGFTGKKLRQFPVHTGATSLGICLANPAVHDLTVSFMKAVGYQGILDIGYRFDARDGRYKLLDPNPRIGSSFRLFVAQDGMDVVRYLYLDLTGQPLPPAVPREGRKWVVENQDLESCLDYRREGALSLGEWWRSYRGVEEAAWLAGDDLRPFRKVLGEFFAKGWRWIWRRLLGGKPEPRGTPVELRA